MRFRIFLFQVKCVVRSNYVYTILLRELQKYGVYPLLFFQPVSHQLNIKIIFKQIMPPCKCLFCNLFPAIQYQIWNFTGETSRCGDNSLPVFFYKLTVNTRKFVVIAFNKSKRTHLCQIFIALSVFSQKYLPVTFVFMIPGKFFLMAIFNKIGFQADNGFYTCLFCG